MVGHSLHDDFLALRLNQDEYECEIREISEYVHFKRPCYGYKREVVGYEKRKLKELAKEFLNAQIQEGHHSSIIDARVALALYRNFQ